MYGRMYSIVFESVAVAALQDFFEVVAAADSVVVLHSVTITQETEVADAAEEMLTVVIQKGATTSGSGGAAATPRPHMLGSAAFGGTAEVNNTTEASGGTIVNVHRESFNVRSGFYYRPTPEERHVLSPSARMTITLINTTPADSITMNGTMIVEEIGG
jgi:hypothetical protein